MSQPEKSLLGNTPEEVLNFVERAMKALKEAGHLGTMVEIVDTIRLIGICEQRARELSISEEPSRPLDIISAHKGEILALFLKEAKKN